MNVSVLQQNLYLELQKGKFCYVSESTTLACQILSKATCHAMTQQGYRSLSVSTLTSPPADLKKNTSSAEQTWDQRMITAVWQGLHPNDMNWLSQWLDTTAQLSIQQRLVRFADELLLSDLCEGPLLICLDNIDNLRSHPSAINELLDWITYCYELRDTYLTYRHLSVVAFGTAVPAEFSPHSQPVTILQSTHAAAKHSATTTTKSNSHPSAKNTSKNTSKGTSQTISSMPRFMTEFHDFTTQHTFI